MGIYEENINTLTNQIKTYEENIIVLTQEVERLSLLLSRRQQNNKK